MFDSTTKKELIVLAATLAVTTTAKVVLSKMVLANIENHLMTQEKLQQMYFTK